MESSLTQIFALFLLLISVDHDPENPDNELNREVQTRRTKEISSSMTNEDHPAMVYEVPCDLVNVENLRSRTGSNNVTVRNSLYFSAEGASTATSKASDIGDWADIDYSTQEMRGPKSFTIGGTWERFKQSGSTLNVDVNDAKENILYEESNKITHLQSGKIAVYSTSETNYFIRFLPDECPSKNIEHGPTIEDEAQRACTSVDGSSSYNVNIDANKGSDECVDPVESSAERELLHAQRISPFEPSSSLLTDNATGMEVVISNTTSPQSDIEKTYSPSENTTSDNSNNVNRVLGNSSSSGNNACDDTVNKERNRRLGILGFTEDIENVQLLRLPSLFSLDRTLTYHDGATYSRHSIRVNPPTLIYCSERGHYISLRCDKELDMFGELLEELTQITDLSLRLQIITRDVYWAGVYSGLDLNNLDVVNGKIDEHFRKAREQFPNKAELDLLYQYMLTKGKAPTVADFKALYHIDDAKSKATIKRSPSKRAITKSSKIVNSSNSSGINVSSFSAIEYLCCVFCDSKKAECPSLDFMYHPYVNKTFSGADIFMCMPCVVNWDDYRSKLDTENGLILPGEQNEELCAICSDTPDELTMCSTCVRSYCRPCLRRSCSVEDLNALETEEEWNCMCCKHDLGQMVVPKKNWVLAGGATIPKKLGLGAVDGWRDRLQNPPTKRYEDIESMQLPIRFSRVSDRGEDSKAKGRNKAGRSMDGGADVARHNSSISTNANGRPARAKATSQSSMQKQLHVDAANKSQEFNGMSIKIGTIPSEEQILLCDACDAECPLSMSGLASVPPDGVEWFCDVCMILCDGCEGEFPWSRHGLTQVPEGNWFCPACESILDQDLNDVNIEKSKVKRGKDTGSLKITLPVRRNALNGKNASTAIKRYEPTAAANDKQVLTAKKIKKEPKHYSSSKKKSEDFGPHVPLPVSTDMDELDFFKQYADYIDRRSKEAYQDIGRDSEDYCFLCKDGGDLIECDYCTKYNSKTNQMSSSSQQKIRCRKVYHAYCLGYEMPEAQVWHCPRTFCTVCGESAKKKSIKFTCKYCTISLCGDCPTEYAKQYDTHRYVALDKPRSGWEFSGSTTHMACHHCIQNFEKLELRSETFMFKEGGRKHAVLTLEERSFYDYKSCRGTTGLLGKQKEDKPANSTTRTSRIAKSSNTTTISTAVASAPDGNAARSAPQSSAALHALQASYSILATNPLSSAISADTTAIADSISFDSAEDIEVERTKEKNGTEEEGEEVAITMADYHKQYGGANENAAQLREDEEPILLCDGCDAECPLSMSGHVNVPPNGVKWFCEACAKLKRNDRDVKGTKGSTGGNSKPRGKMIATATVLREKAKQKQEFIENTEIHKTDKANLTRKRKVFSTIPGMKLTEPGEEILEDDIRAGKGKEPFPKEKVNVNVKVYPNKKKTCEKCTNSHKKIAHSCERSKAHQNKIRADKSQAGKRSREKSSSKPKRKKEKIVCEESGGKPVENDLSNEVNKGNYIHCCGCDDKFELSQGESGFVSEGAKWYCEQCTILCDGCEREFAKTLMGIEDNDENEEWYCTDCIISCHKCDEKFPLKQVGLDKLPEGEWFCLSCEMHREKSSVSVPLSDASGKAQGVNDLLLQHKED